MRDGLRLLLQGQAVRAFDRGTGHPARMCSRPASQVFRLIAPATDHQGFIRNPFRQRSGPRAIAARVYLNRDRITVSILAKSSRFEQSRWLDRRAQSRGRTRQAHCSAPIRPASPTLLEKPDPPPEKDPTGTTGGSTRAPGHGSTPPGSRARRGSGVSPARISTLLHTLARLSFIQVGSGHDDLARGCPRVEPARN